MAHSGSAIFRDFRVAFLFINVLIYIDGSKSQVDIDHSANQTAPVGSMRYTVPNLPLHHYRYWLKNHPYVIKEFQEICSKVNDPLKIKTIDYFVSFQRNLIIEDPRYWVDLEYGKTILNEICSTLKQVDKYCWGYEANCQLIHTMPECNNSGSSKGEGKQKIAWFNQADFGYILERRREMSKFCSPDNHSNHTVKSSLECTKFFRLCRGQDLIMRLNNIPKEGSLIQEHIRDLIKKGDLGGQNCDLQLKRIPEEGGQRGVLQSWFNELGNYTLLSGDQKCDLTIDEMTYIVKPDAPTNMYHYFCTFLNMYATMHLTNRFSDDNQIVIWDNRLPRSMRFDIMWFVFSRKPLLNIGQFENKRVCFKKFTFALLPRMIDGLYYNTKLEPGCSKSGLFDAFNKYVLHKLNIQQEYNKTIPNDILRVTIISRSTPSRKILNEIDLKNEVENRNSEFAVRLVDYSEIEFKEQLRISQNTDILVGIHGAGLTHTLFLPDWAAVYEVFDCEDKCYHDLARLRGVNYFTMDKRGLKKKTIPGSIESEKLKGNNQLYDDKQSNYEININNFMDTLEKAAKHVRLKRSKHFDHLKEPINEANLRTEEAVKQKVGPNDRDEL